MNRKLLTAVLVPLILLCSCSPAVAPTGGEPELRLAAEQAVEQGLIPITNNATIFGRAMELYRDSIGKGN